MSSAAESPSEEGDQLEAAGIVEGMDNVNLDADFSLELLTQHFNDSTATPGDKENNQNWVLRLHSSGLCLASYVKGYREVYKFLNLLGTVFGWVGSDVWAKIVQLEKYLGGEEKEHYQNCKAMIEYEVITKKKEDLLTNPYQKVEHDLIKTKKKDDPSGSRTLLRLHRALEYIIAFLHKLDDIQDADLCSVISVEAYEATLMKYHPWVVQVLSISYQYDET